MSLQCKPCVADPRIRCWPYPYRAAVSLSNDVDFCSFEFFEAFMRYSNTTQVTPFGEGLGLEVTSSFFGFSPPGRQFSYFDGLSPDAPPSSAAPRVAEYIRAGWIDANHAYGDFDGVGGFARAHAERLHEEIDRLGGDIRVFINHGDENNRQCIGPGTDHHKGDVTGAPEYHADLMRPGCPWYVTTSGHSIGHVDEMPPPTGFVPARWPRFLLSGKAVFRDGEGRLLLPYRLQDGRTVSAFMRLRGTGFNAPNLGALSYQVDLVDLEKLCRDEACAVLYQHWGVLHRAGRRCVPATVDEVSGRPEIMSGLRRLACESRAGRLWVAGLQRLLDYVLMIENTTVKRKKGAGEFEVVSAVPVERPTDFFQGLTIYIDPAVESSVRYEGKLLPILYNGPDHTGRYSISVRRTPKENIW